MPLILSFDVDDKGSAKIEKIEGNVEGLNKKLDKTKKSSKNMGEGMDSAANSARRLEKETRGLDSSLVSMAKAAVSVYAVKEVFDAIVGSGIEYNRQMETLKLGMASLVSVNAEFTTSTGVSLSNMERYSMALDSTSDIMERLKKVNIETAHTLDQTAQTFKTIYSSAMNAGASMDQTMELTKLLSQSASAAGADFNAFMATVDGVVDGTYLANSEYGRFLKTVGLTPAVLKEAAKEGKSIDLLMEKLGGFSAVGEVVQQSLDGIVSNLQNTIDEIRSGMNTDIFDGYKLALSGLNDILSENKGDILTFVDELGMYLESLGDRLMSSFSGMEEPLNNLGDTLLGLISNINAAGESLADLVGISQGDINWGVLDYLSMGLATTDVGIKNLVLALDSGVSYVENLFLSIEKFGLEVSRGVWDVIKSLLDGFNSLAEQMPDFLKDQGFDFSVDVSGVDQAINGLQSKISGINQSISDNNDGISNNFEEMVANFDEVVEAHDKIDEEAKKYSRNWQIIIKNVETARAAIENISGQKLSLLGVDPKSFDEISSVANVSYAQLTEDFETLAEKHKGNADVMEAIEKAYTQKILEYNKELTKKLKGELVTQGKDKDSSNADSLKKIESAVKKYQSEIEKLDFDAFTDGMDEYDISLMELNLRYEEIIEITGNVALAQDYYNAKIKELDTKEAGKNLEELAKNMKELEGLEVGAHLDEIEQKYYQLGEKLKKAISLGADDETVRLLTEKGIEEIEDAADRVENKWKDTWKSIAESFQDDLVSAITSGDWGSVFEGLGKNLGKAVLQDITDPITSGLFGTSSGGSGLVSGVLSGGMSQSSGIMGDFVSSVLGGGSGTVGNIVSYVTGSDSSVGSAEGSGLDISSLGDLYSVGGKLYSMVTDGVQGTILKPFEQVATQLSDWGLTGTSSFVNEFGAGLTNLQMLPSWAGGTGVTASTAGTAISGTPVYSSTAYTAGSMLGGAGLGYGVGSLGDSVFGAQTQASNFGAIGGAIGSIVPGIGTLLGAGIGSVIGGMFGSWKVKDTGIALADGMSGFDAEVLTSGTGQFNDFDESEEVVTDPNSVLDTYVHKQKKSWFSKKNKYKYEDIDDGTRMAIVSSLQGYEGLLESLDAEITSMTITAEEYGNKWSGSSLIDTVMPKEFLQNLMGLEGEYRTKIEKGFGLLDTDDDKVWGLQEKEVETYSLSEADQKKMDEVWKAWEDYAKDAELEVNEAIASAFQGLGSVSSGISDHIAGIFGNDLNQVNFSRSNEALTSMEQSVGVDVNLSNFESLKNAAIAASPTPETIEVWSQLGQTLLSAEQAAAQAMGSLSQSFANAGISTEQMVMWRTQLTNAEMSEGDLMKMLVNQYGFSIANASNYVNTLKDVSNMTYYASLPTEQLNEAMFNLASSAGMSPGAIEELRAAIQNMAADALTAGDSMENVFDKAIEMAEEAGLGENAEDFAAGTLMGEDTSTGLPELPGSSSGGQAYSSGIEEEPQYYNTIEKTLVDGMRELLQHGQFTEVNSARVDALGETFDVQEVTVAPGGSYVSEGEAHMDGAAVKLWNESIRDMHNQLVSSPEALQKFNASVAPVVSELDAFAGSLGSLGDTAMGIISGDVFKTQEDKKNEAELNLQMIHGISTANEQAFKSSIQAFIGREFKEGALDDGSLDLDDLKDSSRYTKEELDDLTQQLGLATGIVEENEEALKAFRDALYDARLGVVDKLGEFLKGLDPDGMYYGNKRYSEDKMKDWLLNGGDIEEWAIGGIENLVQMDEDALKSDLTKMGVDHAYFTDDDGNFETAKAVEYIAEEFLNFGNDLVDIEDEIRSNIEALEEFREGLNKAIEDTVRGIAESTMSPDDYLAMMETGQIAGVDSDPMKTYHDYMAEAQSLAEGGITIDEQDAFQKAFDQVQSLAPQYIEAIQNKYTSSDTAQGAAREVMQDLLSLRQVEQVNYDVEQLNEMQTVSRNTMEMANTLRQILASFDENGVVSTESANNSSQTEREASRAS